jgi:hypothetical protein
LCAAQLIVKSLGEQAGKQKTWRNAEACVFCVLQVGGSVLYNKTPFSKFVVERTAAYVDQVRR